MAQRKRRTAKAKSKSQRTTHTKSKRSKTPKPIKQTERVHNPHDSFFHRTFSQLEHAREFMATFLPHEIVDQLNLEQMVLKQDKYTDEQLKNHITDLLFEVPLQITTADKSDIPLTIYCLYEHKSAPEADLPFQIQRYMHERWLADQRDGKALRPIIVLLFYHGKENWTIPTQFLDQFEGVSPIFHRFIPKFEYILFDASVYKTDEILTQIESGSLQASLLLLKYIYDDALSEKVPEILRPLAETDLSIEQLMAHLEAILTYMTGIRRPVPDQILNQVVNNIFSEGETMIKSITERWKEEGINTGIGIGLSQGLEQGIEKGRQEKQREMIGLILNHRFQLRSEELLLVASQLAPIQSEQRLDTIVNLALNTEISDFASFIIHLSADESKGEA